MARRKSKITIVEDKPKNNRGKNLIKDKYGAKINNYGVRFTKGEQEKLKRLVMRYRQQRKAEIDTAIKLSDTAQARMAQGQFSDFIRSRYFTSASLQQFESKDAFNKYIKYIEKSTNHSYRIKKIRAYKANYLKAIENVYGKNAYTRAIKKALNAMSDKEYMEFVLKNEGIAEIYYQYPPNNQTLYKILEALKLDTTGLERVLNE